MIYIDSTIHHHWNRKFNIRLCKALEKRGVKVYLPQRDTIQDEKIIFKQNHAAIRKSKKVLAIALNETPNWGVEIGFAHALGKKIIALVGWKHQIPFMARSMFCNILEVRDLDDVDEYIDRLIDLLQK